MALNLVYMRFLFYPDSVQLTDYKQSIGDNMDIYDLLKEQNKNDISPLADRMRPESIDEIVGQKDIISPGKLLYRAIKADKLSSIIFWGPPGTGKTSIAHVIAMTSKSEFKKLNAVSSGKKDMEEIVSDAREHLPCMDVRPYCLWTRFTDSIRDSRTFCFHMWKMEQSF